jgi:hypothetical protein
VGKPCSVRGKTFRFWSGAHSPSCCPYLPSPPLSPGEALAGTTELLLQGRLSGGLLWGRAGPVRSKEKPWDLALEGQHRSKGMEWGWRDP